MHPETYRFIFFMKDPAFLFYSQDWIVGTSFMTMEERGQYITLLALIHQHGHLSPERVGLVLGYGLGKPNLSIQSKFQIDENGCWFNERLDAEIQKRAKYIDKQVDNGKKGGRPKTQTKPKDNPTTNPNTNPNESISFSSSFSNKKDSNTDFPPQFSIEHCITVAMNDDRWVKANKVKEQDLKQFNLTLEKRGIYQKNPADYKTHFANWRSGGKKEYENIPPHMVNHGGPILKRI